MESPAAHGVGDSQHLAPAPSWLSEARASGQGSSAKSLKCNGCRHRRGPEVFSAAVREAGALWLDQHSLQGGSRCVIPCETSGFWTQQ